jgi:hypothetical protein
VRFNLITENYLLIPFFY